MIFAHAERLWWLLPLFIGWCFALYLYWQRENLPPYSHFFRLSLSPQLVRFCQAQQRQFWNPRRRWQALRVLVLLFLCIGLLGPQYPQAQRPQRIKGVSIMLVVDTSQSMQALDLDTHRPIGKRRNRLQVVQDVVSHFVAQRPADSLGTVVFGSEAFHQCPLTLDHELVTQMVKQWSPGMVGDSTAIGTGLAVAVKRLQKIDSRSKVIVLLTDGSNNSGNISPIKAAELAQRYGIKVYTIGVGSRGKAPFIVDGVFGPQVHYMEADLDENTLKQIANIAQGAYFRAEESSKLMDIYNHINRLEKSPQQRLLPTPAAELFPWFLLVATLAWGLEIWKVHGKWQKIP
jgi:Ca-activated chloride channel family protein